jgi:hypothetical protein
MGKQVGTATFVAAMSWALLVVIAVHALDFPGSVPDFQKAANGGTLLDARPAFSPDALYRRLAEYGDEGRRNYALRNVTVDVLLPISVLPFLVLLNRRAADAFSATARVRTLLLLVPVLYVVADLIENGTVLRLLSAYPRRQDGLASTLAYTTVIKRVASLLALVIPLVILTIQRVRKRISVELQPFS